MVERVLTRTRLCSLTNRNLASKDQKRLTLVGMVTDLVVELVVEQRINVLVATAARWGEQIILRNDRHNPVHLPREHLERHLVSNQVSTKESTPSQYLAHQITGNVAVLCVSSTNVQTHTRALAFLTVGISLVSEALPLNPQ